MPAVAVAVVAATSCSTTPKSTPRTPAPTALVCQAPAPTGPGSVVGDLNLAVNGSFATPKIKGRRSVLMLPGWSVSGAVKLVASTSCLPVPPDDQYLALGYGGAVSHPVPTVKGHAYAIQFYDSMEGICNTAGAVLNAYWNSVLVGASITRATSTTPDSGDAAWGSYGSFTATVIATGTTGVIRVVATTEAFSCALDISHLSVVIKPPA